MAYTLLILRDPDDPENRITPAEWREFMHSDPDLRPFSDYGENAALLPSPSGVNPAENWPAWLDFYGYIYIRCASQHTIPKIFEIAHRLKARVSYREKFYDSAAELLGGIPDWARDVIYEND
jgi:hypothetical protein